MLLFDAGGKKPPRRPVSGGEEESVTAMGGLFFGKKPTKGELRQDAEIAFFLEQAGYPSARAMVHEVAAVAERLSHYDLATTIRRRSEIRLRQSSV